MVRTCTEKYCTQYQVYRDMRQLGPLTYRCKPLVRSPMARGPYYGAGLVGLVKSHMGLHLTCIEQQASLQACPQTTFFVGAWEIIICNCSWIKEDIVHVYRSSHPNAFNQSSAQVKDFLPEFKKIRLCSLSLIYSLQHIVHKLDPRLRPIWRNSLYGIKLFLAIFHR
jgi:hypothetical protein